MKDQLAYRRIAIAPELHRRVEKFAAAQKIPLKKAFIFDNVAKSVMRLKEQGRCFG